MIAKLTIGNGLRGAVSYDLLPKKGEPNRAEWICGTLGGIGATPQQISRQGGLLRALRPEIKNPIWRCSLSLPPSDGRRDGAFWKQIVEEFLIEMEIPLDAGWLAVRHDDQNHDHLHLSVVRILPNSKLWNRANDLPKAVMATQKLELRHGLASHSRQKPSKASPTLADRQISKRKSKPMSKPYIQNAIDDIFKSNSGALDTVKLQILLADMGVGLDVKRTKEGKLQGFSYSYADISFPASALGTEYSTSGLIKRGLRIKDQIDLVVAHTGKPTATASCFKPNKMPEMIKPLLSSTHGSPEVRSHATHQTEVMDAPMFNLKPIENPQLTELSSVMAMLGYACKNVALDVLIAILNLIAAVLRRFGFNMLAAKNQPVSNQSHQIPLFYSPCIESTPHLPAPNAEHQVAAELLRVVNAVVNHSPHDLPLVKGTELERELAFAALINEEKITGATVAVDADIPHNSNSVATEQQKIDRIQVLNTAILAHDIAAKELLYAQIKKGPMHQYLDKKIAIELRAVRNELDEARDKLNKFCIDFPIKSRFPCSEKTKLLADVANLEMSEKNLLHALKEAMDENARIEKVYAAIPPPIVPPSVASLELETRQAVHNARSTIHVDALDLIKSIKGDPHQSQYLTGILAENESKILESWRSFGKDQKLSLENLETLKFQINELQRLKNMQAAAEDAAMFQQDGSYLKPKVDGQIQK